MKKSNKKPSISRRQTLKTGVAVAAALATPAILRAKETHQYILATASTGGTYYPVGVALSTLTRLRLTEKTGIEVNAINSAGSGEHAYLLQRNEAQFAIMQSVFVHFASTGSGALPRMTPQKDLRSISMLWSNAEHPIIRNEFVDTGTISDFAAMNGRIVSLGRLNSGTIGSNRVLLSNLGYNFDADFEKVSLSYNATADAFMNHQIDGAIIAGGIPVSAVTRLMASAGGGVTLLSSTDEQVAAGNRGTNLWNRFVIPANTYPGQDRDFKTMATSNQLTCRKDVPDEHVFQITKAMYENLPFLRAIHGATNEMNVEGAIAGLGVPLHAGALRYYKEAGLDIPAHLDVN